MSRFWGCLGSSCFFRAYLIIPVSFILILKMFFDRWFPLENKYIKKTTTDYSIMQGSESSPSKLGDEISTSLAHNSQQKGYQTNLSVQQPQQTQSQRGSLEAFGSTSSPLRDHYSFGSSSAHTTNASMVDREITKLGDTEDQIECVDHDGTDVVVAEEQVYTSLEKDMKWERSPEREELTRARMAERAAEWGLVLKSDVVTGRICGVTTRKSLGEYEYSAGDRSSGDWTSSGTSSTFPGTSTRTSMRKSRTSMRMSGTSMRTASGEALEDDKCSNTSSYNLPIISLELKDALSSFEQSFVVSDATTPEFPIMYASGGFFSMTGYSSQEVMGQNCRFLQGPGTDKKDVAKVREAVYAGKSFCGRILNYKKDGSTFWNLLTITPIKGDDGKVLKFIGMQVEVSKYTEGTKANAIRPNGLPESLIRYDARLQDKATESATELVRVFQKSRPAVQALNISDLQPVEGDGGLAALYAQKPNDVPTPGVQQAGARTGGTNQQFSQANILDGFQQTSRDGFPGIWSKSQLLNNVVVNNSLTVGDGAPQRSRRSSGFLSLLGIQKSSSSSHAEEEVVDTRLMMKAENLHKVKRSKEIRQGLDLATTLERIAKNFVITDPRLPDNPIVRIPRRQIYWGSFHTPHHFQLAIKMCKQCWCIWHFCCQGVHLFRLYN
jgi:PAS domain S-box-containing protein